MTFLYKDELHLDPATVGMVMSIGTFPWVIKPVYGFLSDTVPLFGYRRRSYLVACGLLGEIATHVTIKVSWTTQANRGILGQLWGGGRGVVRSQLPEPS